MIPDEIAISKLGAIDNCEGIAHFNMPEISLKTITNKNP